MKSKRILLSIAAVVGILVAAAYLYDKNDQNSGYLVLYGNVDVRTVDIGFRVYGKLEKLHFEEGDEVKPGDLLAELDPSPYLMTLKQNEERVNSLSASFKNAEILFKRREELIATNSVSQQEYDDALFNMEAILSNLNEAQAARGNAQIQVDDTRITSLVAGTILTRVREPGTIVTVGDPIYVVSITSPVWIRTYVNEPNLGKIYPGMEAEIYTDTKTNPVYHGKIGFISPVAEFTPKNVETTDLRTDLVYRLRIYADDPTHGLLQGMPVTVKLRLK
jgi:HlyD family secretion protein